jgi:hypothetical protein
MVRRDACKAQSNTAEVVSKNNFFSRVDQIRNMDFAET